MYVIANYNLTKIKYCIFFLQCNFQFAGNGEKCAPDSDKDGIPDIELQCEGKECRKDNCKRIPNSGQEDADKDGKG